MRGAELQHRLGVTSVYVTHDLEEALAMSDRIAVMRGGEIEQLGTPAAISIGAEPESDQADRRTSDQV